MFLNKFRSKFNIGVVYVLILLSLSVYLCYKNFIPNTFLTGWDTLHPEFDYASYFGRIIFGAWQEHQGLGAVATQAHSSEIPRIILLFILDLFVDTSVVRYLYAFLMLILGPLGIYFYIKNILLIDLSPKVRAFGGFFGGLFYLLNLGTLQHFYVPLEMFLTQYGLIGWVFLFSTNFFEKFDKKSYIWFVISLIFITPQAHTPTLFYTFLLAFLLYFVVISIVEIQKTRSIGSNFKRLFVIFFTVFLVNSYWMFSSIYFLLTSAPDVQASKIHHLFSDEAFLANVKFGTLQDIAILKGFLFDWGEHVGSGKFGPLLDEWQRYYASTHYDVIGYVLFICVLIGLLYSVYKKHPYWLGLALVSFMSIIFLFTINPPTGFIMEFLLQYFPLLKEILRFPFTKFSILLMFGYASFFGFFGGFIGELLLKTIKKHWTLFILKLLIVISLIFVLFLYMRPAFDGYLISPSMKVSIPSRYFELFEYLKQDDSFGRVADFPLHSFWGWEYYSWNAITKLGYQGAGFLWFGIQKPLIDREFDRWNIANEQVYRELSYAVYSENLNLLEQTLEKYKIKWLLVDESIIAPEYKDSVLFYAELEDLFKQSDKISLEKSFGKGLHLYKYNSAVPFSLRESGVPYKVIGNHFFREFKDSIYDSFGNYIYSKSNTFPFISVLGVDEEITQDFITSDATNFNFITSDLSLGNDSFSYQKIKSNLLEVSSTNSIFSFDNEFYSYKGLVELPVFKEDITKQVYQYSPGVTYSIDLYPNLINCSSSSLESSYSVERLSSGFALSARNTKACVTADLSNFKDLYTNRSSNIFTLIGNGFSNKDVCIYDKETSLCKNFSIDDVIYAYLDKPIDSYSLRVTSDSFITPFEKVKTFTDIKVGWLSLGNVFEIVNILDTTKYNNLIIPKDTRYSDFVSNLANNPSLCDLSTGDLDTSSIKYGLSSITYSSSKHSLCDSFYFHTLDQSKGYILEVKSRNIEGVPLRFCLTNEQTKRCDAYFSLPANKELKSNYYILPSFSDGVGYTVNISNNNFGDFPATNELSYISFTPINYDLIKGLHTGAISNLETKNNIFVYNEAFDKGWLAICGGEICDAEHVVFNNWANGWVFNGKVPENITIIFWPQYLQYFGYLLLLVPFYIVFRLPASHKETKHHKNTSHSEQS